MDGHFLRQGKESFENSYPFHLQKQPYYTILKWSFIVVSHPSPLTPHVMLVDIVCQCGRSARVDDTNPEEHPHCLSCGKTLSLAQVQTVTRQASSLVPGTNEVDGDTIGAPLAPSTVTGSPSLPDDSYDFELQTTVLVEKENTPPSSGEKTTIFSPLSFLNKQLQGDHFEVRDSHLNELPVGNSDDDDFSVHEESLKFCTHAERLLNADPFYRITRAKRSKVGKLDSNQGFVYGIHRLVRSHVKGGMGMVHIAYDQFLKREVALKELFQHSTADESIVHRFIVEAEITAQLEHPGIIPVHSLGLDLNGNPYYTMKLIRGKTFQEAIKQYFKAPSEQELKRLVRRFVSVCQTMAFVHSKGVIHRDLKPANIMLSDHGETLVMDWGIAKAYNKSLATESGIAFSMSEARELTRSDQAHPDLTLAGTVVGTPAFMSPEQASPDSQEVGPISDIFSLGAILFYLLTGRNAYTGKTSQEILMKVLTTNPPRPSDIARNIPPGLEAICMKAMCRDPKGRYQTTGELVADLCNWLDGEPISAMKETLLERGWRYFRKNRQMSISVFLMIFIFIIICTLSVILVDRKWQREKIHDTYSKTIIKHNEEIEQKIRELENELEVVRKECENYRRERDSTDDDILRVDYDKKLDESMRRVSELDSQIAEQARFQKGLQSLNQAVRKK